MNLEVLALCDAAADYGGRLSILGIFDRVQAPLPTVVPQCAICLRMRYDLEDAGEYGLVITFEDRRGIPLVPPLETRMILPQPESGSGAVNLVLNLQRLRLEREGEFILKARVGDLELGRVPLRVVDATPHEPNPLAE